MAFLRRAFIGLFLIALTAALLAQAGRTLWDAVQTRMADAPPPMPAREQVLAVNVVVWIEAEVRPELSVFGEVLAARTLTLRTATGGTVTETSAALAEGGRVAAGEVLLRIDPAEAEAALARTRADLALAEAELREAERAVMLDRDELAAAGRQQGFRAQALDRQRELGAQGLGTRPDLESAELAAAQAEQAVLAARAAVAAAEARIDTAAAQIARTRIDLAEAERTLADTVVIAPFAGVLTGVTVAPGTRVAPGEALAELIDPGALEVGFRLSTAQHADLSAGTGTILGLPVRVTLSVAGLEVGTQGRITREAARVAEGETGRQVIASIDPDPALRPGDFVTVTVAEPPMAGVARLPARALGPDNSVLVVGPEERLVVTEVTLLRRQGNDVLLRGEGLAGALVVAERSPLLGAGIRVRPIVPGAETAEEAMLALDPDRRARLVAAVEGNDRLPEEARARLLSQLAEPLVPATVVTRIESGMGS
jgi:membrane fusion protein (multidrug efflux system)